MKLLYCLRCEEIVPVEEPVQDHSIIQFVPDERTQEIFWCEGGFESCEPSYIDPDFDVQDEPSQIELVKMNLAAEQLLQDFEGEQYAS